jgi:hypothetical protein
MLTAGDGSYELTFKAVECQIGGPWVQVMAIKTGMSGSGEAPIIDFVDGIASVYLRLDTPTTAVPEMSTITSIGAGIAAIGAFVWIRRNNQSRLGMPS